MTAHVRQNIYAAWRDGDATAYEALRSLCADYEELDDTYKQFEAIREQTRNQMSEVVATFDGEKAEIKGFGIVRLAAPSVSQSYDTKQVDALVDDLLRGGYAEIAERLARCKKRSERAGGLRIERERKDNDGVK